MAGDDVETRGKDENGEGEDDNSNAREDEHGKGWLGTNRGRREKMGAGVDTERGANRRGRRRRPTHEVAGGEEEVADGGQEGDDGQDVHDAEVADGCRAVIGLARTHQRGRFVLGKHSVHSGWKREMEKKGKGKSKEHQETAKQNITETTTVTRR